jgi:surface polysaccharide O-acyltransferase-like enzyme
MDKRLSVKISIVSFLLLLLVVVAHTINLDYQPGADNTVWYIQYFFSYKLVKIIVPIFFFISGYLFFMNIDPEAKMNLAVYREKIAKRLRTLGVPYLFWSFVGFAFLYVLQMIPQTASYFGSPFHKMTFWQQLWYCFWEPVNYPLWFIREVLLYVLVTPLMFLAVKYLKIWLIAALFIAGIFYTGLNVSDVWIYKFYMLFYYVTGVYCALYKVQPKIVMPFAIKILLIAAALVSFGLIIKYQLVYGENVWPMRLWSNVTVLVLCASLWAVYDNFDARYGFRYREAFSYGFFVCSTHGIPILLFKKAFVVLFSPSKAGLLVFYFFTMVFITLLFWGLGMLLKRWTPGFYYFSTGNR